MLFPEGGGQLRLHIANLGIHQENIGMLDGFVEKLFRADLLQVGKILLQFTHQRVGGLRGRRDEVEGFIEVCRAVLTDLSANFSDLGVGFLTPRVQVAHAGHGGPHLGIQIDDLFPRLGIRHGLEGDIELATQPTELTRDEDQRLLGVLLRRFLRFGKVHFDHRVGEQRAQLGVVRGGQHDEDLGALLGFDLNGWIGQDGPIDSGHEQLFSRK